MALALERCCFPGCTEFARHTHHVTYDPKVTKPLCRRHHEEITILNGQQARRVRHELSNKHRWWIWYQWQQGRLKVRRTKKAMEYIDEWDRGGALLAESQVAAADQAKQDRIDEAQAAAGSATVKRKRRHRKSKANAAGSGRGAAVHKRKGSRPWKRRRKKRRKKSGQKRKASRLDE